MIWLPAASTETLEALLREQTLLTKYCSLQRQWNMHIYICIGPIMYLSQFHLSPHASRKGTAVRDMRWGPDGSLICVAYADGMALVGSSTGNAPRHITALVFTCDNHAWVRPHVCEHPLAHEAYGMSRVM